MKTFRAFVAEQVARGESLPPTMGYQYTEAAQIEICDFLEARTGEDPQTSRQSTLQWLQDSLAARKVKAVMDAIMEGDTAPTISAVREIWRQMYGERTQINPECPDCAGTGFQPVIDATGNSAARKCPRGCAVPPYQEDPPKFDTTPEQRAANTAWAADLSRELNQKMAAKKPVGDPRQEPPSLQNPFTAEDIERAKNG